MIIKPTHSIGTLFVLMLPTCAESISNTVVILVTNQNIDFSVIVNVTFKPVLLRMLRARYLLTYLDQNTDHGT